MRALVTGGEGFIGSYLVDHLIKRDVSVFTADNHSATCNNKFYQHPDAVHFDTDITNSRDIKKLVAAISPDVIFHMGAESRIESANERPEWCWQTNVLGTLNVCQAAAAANVKQIIYSSTSAAYGTVTNRDFAGSNENDPTNCLNHYSVSKVAGESIVSLYGQQNDLNTVILRYFNVYDNPIPSSSRMPSKGPHAPVMAVFARQLYKDKSHTMTITGDGLQERDFVHVDDVARANLRCMELSDSTSNEIINIGSGESISILNIAKGMPGCYNGDWRFINARSGEANITRADIRKAKRLLDWEPEENIRQYLNLKPN